MYGASWREYRIHGNFLGSYISRTTCQEDFCILIFADDLPLNDYTALESFMEFSDFPRMTNE